MENKNVGPFKIIKKLGSHRRHNVFHAVQVEQNREVALKFISLPPGIDRARAYDKLNLEAIVLRRLRHPNLVQVYGAGVEGDKVFFATELVDGEALSTLMSRRGRLAADLVVEYSKQIARVLDYVHDQEILHCKLTTDKVLIQPDGQIKIADLRLNRSRKRRWDAARRAQLETAAYLAPEQLLESSATVKSDLYSLGVIMFEMLTGRLPFEPETMSQLVRDKQESDAPAVSSLVMSCPGWLDKLVGQLLATDPKQRPHSAKAVEISLDQIRLIDQGKKTAVEEMTRGFSALTAGADRSEANKLMGIKKKKRPEDREPLTQSVPFLVASLVLIVLVAAFFLRPTPNTKLMERANTLMGSTDLRDWQRARTLYKRVMSSRAPPELIAEAEKGYFDSRRRQLIRRAEFGLVGLESPNVRRFYVAFQTQKDRKLDEAMTMYQGLVETVDPQGEQQHVYLEAKDRLDELESQKAQAEAVREEILAELTRAKQLLDEANAADAIKIYQQILSDYADNPFLDDFMTKAQDGLDLCTQQAIPSGGEASPEPPDDTNPGSKDAVDPDDGS